MKQTSWTAKPKYTTFDYFQDDDDDDDDDDKQKIYLFGIETIQIYK